MEYIRTKAEVSAYDFSLYGQAREILVLLTLASSECSGELEQRNRPKQCLSGKVLELILKCCMFETHRRHCIVSLCKTLYPLLSTGSTQEDR